MLLHTSLVIRHLLTRQALLINTTAIVHFCTASDFPFHCRRNPPLFSTLLIRHPEEVLPFVYTPTVGEACQRYHLLPLTPRGLYLRATDAGRFLELLRAWPRQNIRQGTCPSVHRPVCH